MSQEKCETCHGTDLGPGKLGNEYSPCDQCADGQRILDDEKLFKSSTCNGCMEKDNRLDRVATVCRKIAESKCFSELQTLARVGLKICSNAPKDNSVEFICGCKLEAGYMTWCPTHKAAQWMFDTLKLFVSGTQVNLELVAERIAEIAKSNKKWSYKDE